MVFTYISVYVVFKFLVFFFNDHHTELSYFVYYGPFFSEGGVALKDLPSVDVYGKW